MTRLLLEQLHQWLHNKPTVFDVVFWAARLEWEWDDIQAAAGIVLAGMVANAIARVMIVVIIVGYRRYRRILLVRPQP